MRWLCLLFEQRGCQSALYEGTSCQTRTKKCHEFVTLVSKMGR